MLVFYYIKDAGQSCSEKTKEQSQAQESEDGVDMEDDFSGVLEDIVDQSEGELSDNEGLCQEISLSRSPLG